MPVHSDPGKSQSCRHTGAEGIGSEGWRAVRLRSGVLHVFVSHAFTASRKPDDSQKKLRSLGLPPVWAAKVLK